MPKREQKKNFPTFSTLSHKLVDWPRFAKEDVMTDQPVSVPAPGAGLPPDFAPVRRYRHDGWTPEREPGFIGALAATGVRRAGGSDQFEPFLHDFSFPRALLLQEPVREGAPIV